MKSKNRTKRTLWMMFNNQSSQHLRKAYLFNIRKASPTNLKEVQINYKEVLLKVNSNCKVTQYPVELHSTWEQRVMLQ
jgi:hypothetical protein